MLPDSIPESLWSEFKKMRTKIKHPMTDYAEELILRKLEKWRVENGANVVAILEESIERSWAGVFLNGHGTLARSPGSQPEGGSTPPVPTCCSCGKSLDAGFKHSRKGRLCHEC